MKKILMLLALASVVTFSACKKDEEKKEDVKTEEKKDDAKVEEKKPEIVDETKKDTTTKATTTDGDKKPKIEEEKPKK